MSTAAHCNAFPSPKFQNLLFTTDLLACSDEALPVALGLAKQFGSTIHVLHVVPPETIVVAEYGMSVPELDAGLEKAARIKLEEFCKSAQLEGVLYTQTVQTGLVCDVANELVKKLNIDLIVMRTHGRRGVKHFLLGSVAEQVFRSALCPVLTVGPEAHTEGIVSGKLLHIVYATDFSQASLLALPYAVSLAKAFKAHLTLVHAIDRKESEFDRFEEISHSKMRLSKLIPVNSDVHCCVATDHRPAVDLITEICNTPRRPAGLIVMGAHHGAGISAHAPWSIAHRIMCAAPCPVLTVCG